MQKTGTAHKNISDIVEKLRISWGTVSLCLKSVMDFCLQYSLKPGLVGFLMTVGFLVMMSSVEHNEIPISNNSCIQ